jgi:ligand-binding sensor domain-containing protein
VIDKRLLFLVLLLLLARFVIIAQKPGDKVLSVFIDEFGHQWFGTDHGLLRKSGNEWKAYNTDPGSPGIINDIRHRSAITPEIWIGTTRGIVRVSYSLKNIISSNYYYSPITGFHSDTINSITFDNKNIGYFATPKGIGIFANSAWRFYSKLIDIYRNEFLSAEAIGDTVYFGTKGEGVARIFKYADAFSGASAYLTPWSSLSGDTITAIYIDSRGYQWYGTSGGISRHVNTETKDGWDFNLSDQLPDKHVNTITGDLRGNIWIGTNGGLIALSPDLEIIKIWTVRDGLPSDVINDLCIDKDMSVWVGTDLGVSHYNGSVFFNYRTSDHAMNFVDLNSDIRPGPGF